MPERLVEHKFRQLRLHHLNNLMLLAKEFSEKFGDKDPCVYSLEGLGDPNFIEDSSMRDFSNLLRQAQVDQVTREHLVDAFGVDAQTQRETFQRLVGKYKEFWLWATKNPDSKIIISLDPDWICDNCPIGLHCLEKLLPRESWDHSYFMTLSKLASMRKYRKTIFQKNDGSFEMPVGLIFDRGFRKGMAEAGVLWA